MAVDELTVFVQRREGGGLPDLKQNSDIEQRSHRSQFQSLEYFQDYAEPKQVSKRPLFEVLNADAKPPDQRYRHHAAAHCQGIDDKIAQARMPARDKQLCDLNGT